MWDIGRKILVIVGFAEFVWAGYKWLNKVEVSFGPVVLGPAEWLALSVAGVLTVLFAGYQFLQYPIAWIRTRSPTHRLRNLESTIRDHRMDSEHANEYPPGLSPTIYAERQSLRFLLRQLKIEFPEKNDHSKWIVFLTLLEPCARHGEIVEARKVLETLKCHPRYNK